MIRTVLAAALTAATLAAPAAVAGPEVPEIGACKLVPMQYPDVVDQVAEAVYDAAPPVRAAVYRVCAL